MALTGHDSAASPDPPRDPVLDRAYAAGASEEPPARLDAAILAAARREVGARPRDMDSRLRRWRAPVALAAVLVLSVTVALLMREEGADRLEEAPLPMADAPPSAGAPAVQPQPAAPPARLEVPSEGLRDAPAAARPETDRNRREQAAAELRQEAPRGLDAPRPAPKPFAEPPVDRAPSGRAASEAPSLRADSPAKEAQPGAAAGVRERAATVEREVAPAQAPSLPAETGPAPRAETGSAPRAETAPAPRAETAPAPRAERAPAQRAERAPAQRTERAPAPPAAAAAPDAAPEILGRLQSQARRASPDSADRMEQKQREDVAAGPPRPVWQGFERQPPEKWLERVEELLRSGRDAEAREMLVEFRRRFPQHPVPSGLDR